MYKIPVRMATLIACIVVYGYSIFMLFKGDLLENNGGKINAAFKSCWEQVDSVSETRLWEYPK